MTNTIRIGQLNTLNRGNIKERYPLMKEALMSVDPDIVTFQEVLDEKLLRKEMENIGLGYFARGAARVLPSGKVDHVLIVSKFPFVKETEVDMRHGEDLVYSTIQTENALLNVFTIHSAWGFQNEGKRLKQAYHIDMKAERLENVYPGSISILAGDLNADPDSRSVRFLKGKDLAPDNMSSTLWVDAYDMAGTPDNWFTTDGAGNSFAYQTALYAGIPMPEYLPKRRIDYILSRGWKFGRSGTPVDFGYIEHPEGVELSDHQGIWADIAIF